MDPTTVFLLFVVVLTALGQSTDVPRPTRGHQIGDLSFGIDIIMPVSIVQCEPVLIYYNIHNTTVNVALSTLDLVSFVFLHPPPGVGYMDWICNIPAGYSFIAYVQEYQYYTVQPGSSDACLGDLTATYSYADYFTTDFQFYTHHSPSGDSVLATSNSLPIIAFPTSSLTTFTADPNLAVTSTTPISTILSTLSSSTTSLPLISSTFPTSIPVSSAFPHKSNKAAITGGVIGGVALILLTLSTIFVCLRKHRNSHPDAGLESPPLHAGSVTTQLGLTNFSALSEDTRLRNVPSRKSRNPEADLAFTLDAARRLTGSQRQAFMASLNASLDLAPCEAPPAEMSILPYQESTTSEAAQEGFPDTTAILDVISRARLSPRERHNLIASLNALLMLDQSDVTPATSTIGDAMSLPPPYEG